MSLLPHEPLALLQPCRRVRGNRICAARLMQNLRRRHTRFHCVRKKDGKGRKKTGTMSSSMTSLQLGSFGLRWETREEILPSDKMGIN
ncbi:hypothetical protein DPMN_045036 [Dreissena polymorpha]|uniref:Uncharacterized protein n=1 Tax=Dreissena polymorpha TaxID=45954 RepID=A0A9D4D3J8_DREPO|nr:hypothetical protein DPMN_045036 [Dreissena polymorpha]